MSLIKMVVNTIDKITYKKNDFDKFVNIILFVFVRKEKMGSSFGQKYSKKCYNKGKKKRR